MKEYASARERSEKVPVQWDSRIALAIPGWIMLAGGIKSLQYMASYLADEVKYAKLISNWVPWIAVLFFVMGWLISHGTEIALLQRRNKLARVLVIALLGMVLFILLVLPQLASNPVFQNLDGVSFLLVSGYFFRYSMFQKEALVLLPSVFFGESKTVK